MKAVTVIDYGVSNLLNVVRAFEYCGAKVEVAETANQILQAERLVLPGVGAFSMAMNSLKTLGYIDPILAYVKSGNPFIGICLGMQIQFDYSEEFGETQGLGLIPGRVVPIPKYSIDGDSRKIPHIGWSELNNPNDKDKWDNSLLSGVNEGDSVYFLHSYMAEPTLEKHCIANCTYGGVKVTAAVQNDNVIGCQFHPEKSGEIGISILQKFLVI